MADDAISALLPLLVGGGGASTGGTGMGNPDVMGALQAMQTPYAQGVPSNAGPIGQIAQALMPLVAGPAYAQQARQQQAEHQRDTLVKVLTLAKSMEGVDLKREEVRQAAKAAGVNEKFYDLWMKAHNEINGDEAIKNAKMKVGPKGVSFEMGGTDKPNYNLNAITADKFREEHGRDPTRTELESLIQKRDVEKQSAIIAATNKATLDSLRAQGINIGSAAPETGGGGFTVAAPKGMNAEEAATLVESQLAQGKDPGTELPRMFGAMPSPELSQQRGTYEPSRINVTGGKLGVTLQRPKESPETATIVGRTQAIVGMKPRLDQVLNDTPDIPNIGVEATRYLLPSELAAKPGLGKAAEMAVLGNPDPKLTDYFQTVGEMNYAMTSLATRLASKSGSARMALLLQPHIPQLALQPSQNKKKLAGLFGPDSVLIQEFMPEGRKAVRSGDLSPSEFGDMLKSFDVIQSVFKQGNKLYGVNAKREVVPLE